MSFVYTHKARASLRDLAYYLKKNGLDSKFIENYMILELVLKKF